MMIENLPIEVLHRVLLCLSGLELDRLEKSSDCEHVQRACQYFPLWRDLEKRIVDGNSRASTVRRRVLRYEAAREYALYCQSVVQSQFTIDEEEDCVVWKPTIEEDDFPTLNLQSFYGPVEASAYEYFCCISDGGWVIWCGFVSTGYEFEESESFPQGFNQLHLQLQFYDIVSKWRRLETILTDDDSDNHITEDVFEDVSITVISVHRDDDDGMELVGTTKLATSSYQHLQRNVYTICFNTFLHLFGSIWAGNEAETPDSLCERVCQLKVRKRTGLDDDSMGLLIIKDYDISHLDLEDR